jgi:hypothetical protein
MPINSRDALGVPPDGAGKKLQVGRTVVLDYTGLAGGEFRHGALTTGQTSAATGIIVSVKPTTLTTGTVEVYPNPKELTDDVFSVAETLMMEGGVVSATISGVSDKYVSHTQVVGGNDPNNHLDVDEYGSMAARFREGDPSVNLAGILATDNKMSLGSYSSPYEDSYDFGYVEVGTVSSTYNTDPKTVTITAGSGTGNSIIRRTNWTHYYQLGATVRMIAAVSIPDPSKTLVTRRWGLYDDDYGVSFTLQAGQLGVTLRSSSTGSLVDTFIPQSEWNKDRLDGSGGSLNLSEVTLDLTTQNTYWVEYFWAAVRFGVFVDGQKITAHVESTQNEAALPLFAYGNFPLAYEVTNTGATASPTSMVIDFAHIVSSEPVTTWTRTRSAFAEPLVIDYADGFVPILSIRAIDLYHAVKNNSWAGITKCTTMSQNAALSADQPVVYRVTYDATLTAPSWITVSDSIVQIDYSATDAVEDPGSQIDTWIARGEHEHKFSYDSIYDADGVALNADGTSTVITLLARPLHPSTTASVSAVLSWEELL